MDYKDTLNLPQTAFPMKANLSAREPGIIEFWKEKNIYKRLIEARRNSPIFSFHDGPPYANGHIHYGHILNKILKDIIVKYKCMSGYLTRYIPGWDCHGLPIELAVERENPDIEDPVEMRRLCTDYAQKFISIQMEEFIRLGTFATYETPYKTMNPEYEATVLRALGYFVKQGAVYRSDMPIFWCINCHTALALAEIEYEDHRSHSIYVHFPVIQEDQKKRLLGLCGISNINNHNVSIMIWTTTPWTLPANLAIALHPKFQYGLMETTGHDGRKWLTLIAAEMESKVQMGAKITGKMVGNTVSGEMLEGLRTRHPFEDRDSPVVLADYVTAESGTGAVHTAPGHGAEDYITGIKYNLPAFAPVDGNGKFTGEVKFWKGENVFDANPLIVEHLYKTGFLANPPDDYIVHSYPHCWRCKEPVIFRATSQWFISMDKTEIRQKAIAEIDRVRWIPEWGKDDIKGKVSSRPDWCISRQRVWGVHLPFLYCDTCGEPCVRTDIIEKTAEIVSREGSIAWIKRPVEDFMPSGFSCPKCGSRSMRKESDIFDVWFESGVSWFAVSVREHDQGFSEKNPASGYIDLYLEGKDQHRGWFHTALLTGIGVRGKAPYRIVLTHGFVVDEEGKRYSKSKIEKLRSEGQTSAQYIPPEEIIQKYGAELLRLWVSYEDFRDDIAFSENILARLTESYRKIRNTFRFLLGNISDFNPSQDSIPVNQLQPIDKWLLIKLKNYIRRIIGAYESYEFHRIHHDISHLMNVELSAFYLDILKDRLYCEDKRGQLRRSAQTVMYIVAQTVCRMLAPILSFTSEEVWQHLPKSPDAPDSVFLAGMPKLDELPEIPDEGKILADFEKIKEVREKVNKKLEEARNARLIGQSLEASVELKAGGELLKFLKEWEEILADLFIVSSIRLIESAEGNELFITVQKAPGKKCPRCWKYFIPEKDMDSVEVCKRCDGVIKRMQN